MSENAAYVHVRITYKLGTCKQLRIMDGVAYYDFKTGHLLNVNDLEARIIQAAQIAFDNECVVLRQFKVTPIDKRTKEFLLQQREAFCNKI